MKLFFKLSFFVLTAVFISISCKEKVDLKKKEEKLIKEQLSNIKVDFYKTIKVTVRASAAMPNDPEFAAARKNMLGLVTGIFRYSVDESGKVVMDTTSISIMDAIGMAKSFYDTKDVLLKKDEDDFPTILDNIVYVFTGKKLAAGEGITYFTSYDNNYEHAILGALWILTPSAPKEFSLYEFYKTEEDKIQDKEIVIIVKMAKSLMFYKNNYYFHSKEKSDQYLETIEKNKDYLIQHPFVNLFEESKLATPEAQYYQLHSIGYVMRALAEEEMEMEDEANEDYVKFIEEAEKGGGDNELIWLTGTYVYLKKEDNDKALVYLNKLEKSNNLGDPEREAVAEVKKYLNERDSEKALTKFEDKLTIVKITYDLIGSRITDGKKMKEFKESKEGKNFTDFQKNIQDKADVVNSLEKYSNVDSLTAKAKGLVKGLFGK